jgi:NADH:ubiquinone oxidoreductase subunit 5 (subunit L)/multisubunit Na+/H+ antiporter MnhA subunit
MFGLGISLSPLLLAAVVAATHPDPAVGARRGAALAGLAWAAATAVTVSTSGDLFDALVLLLVVGMGATVLAYASRALRHEPYQRRFATTAPLVLLATAVSVTADQLELVLAGWLVTSLTTVALVSTGPPSADPARSVRLSRAFLVGDIALATAVVATLTGVAPSWVAAIALVTAAASRGAAGPFARWLPDTLAAPTPSSALLHAGVVASGVLVVIRHGATIAPDTTGALTLAIAAVATGAITCIAAEAVMTTRPDVKGQLAWSTIAQLGFTLMLVGFGFHVAAGLHAVAHGLYKGSAFLGAGSTVRSLVRRRQAGGAASSRIRWSTVAVTGLGAATAAGVVQASGTAWTTELALTLGLGLVAVASAARAAAGRLESPGQLLTVAGAAMTATAAYSAATVALKAQVDPELVVPGSVLPAIALVPALVGLAAVAATRDRALPGLWARVEAIGAPTPASVTPKPALRWERRTAVSTTRPATTSGA